MHTVLFVCTGNYYRSRFAEEWFNHLARTQPSAWRADSRGLLDSEAITCNPGPISVHTVAFLRELGVEPIGHERLPKPIEDDAPNHFSPIVCVNGPEHRPMVEARPRLAAADILYWDIRDVREEPSHSALVRCKAKVDALFAQLTQDHTP
ncbi:MAG: low molecular weight phosphatase family protein [Myxococcota bacterium]